MAQAKDTPSFASTEEAIITLFCSIDGAYTHLNPRSRCYEFLNSEILIFALIRQLWGVESERSFLRGAARFFSHLSPGLVGLTPFSLCGRLSLTLRMWYRRPGHSPRPP